MSNLRSRLQKCFTLVLPDLSADEISLASMSSMPAWDSLANVNLVAVLEEEFGLELQTDELQELISFELILDFLESKTR